MNFITEHSLLFGTWQAFERSICRLLISEGYSNVRKVGATGDKGADVLATKYNKRWLFQAKQWSKPVGITVVQETISAQRLYNAQIPVIVSSRGFESSVYEYRKVLMSQGINLQLWSGKDLIKHFNALQEDYINKYKPRDYQEVAIQQIVSSYTEINNNRALIVLATGLGKTFVAAEAIRRINNIKKCHVLVLAHTNPLVYQLESSFWPFLKPSESTVIWNGYEHPDFAYLKESDFVFACIDTVNEAIKNGTSIPFDLILVDECHHAGSDTYKAVLEHYEAGKTGAMLIGLTATPWRTSEKDLIELFGPPRITIDMVYGMKHGYLSNVDYRMHTDNINWDSLKNLNGKTYSPKYINRYFFINQWDDAVVNQLHKSWSEQRNPRCIVFCGTIDHADIMAQKINSLAFCNASAIHSKMGVFERNKVLSDFSDGIVNVICTVDVFNEGIDVPDVNIIVFQRVTHSRRIFIQQLGRGLRISEGKEKVIVLDFVSDIRRFAAGLDLKAKLYESQKGDRIDLPNKVTFKRVDGADPKAETFLKEWLEDVAAIADANEDVNILKFPPKIE